MKEQPVNSLLKTLTLKRIYNIFLISLSYTFSVTFKKVVVWGKPLVLTIEPTNRCNLACPQCSTGSGKSTRSQGDMQSELFRRIIKELSPTAIQVLLFDQGEPFLHKHVIDFITIAKQYHLCVTTSTNGTLLGSEKRMRDIVLSGLDAIIISLDGASEQTYCVYRRGGKFNKVVESIKKLIIIKQKLRKTTPAVYLQFVVMKHNEHEISAIQELGRRLNVDRVLLKSVYLDNYKNTIEFLPRNVKYQRYNINSGKLEIKRKNKITCRRPWFSLVVHWDGAIVPCCFDKDNRYIMGNADSTDIEKIWTSIRYQMFRKTIIKRNESIDICNNCTEGLDIYF